MTKQEYIDAYIKERRRADKFSVWASAKGKLDNDGSKNQYDYDVEGSEFAMQGLVEAFAEDFNGANLKDEVMGYEGCEVLDRFEKCDVLFEYGDHILYVERRTDDSTVLHVQNGENRLSVKDAPTDVVNHYRKAMTGLAVNEVYMEQVLAKVQQNAEEKGLILPESEATSDAEY